MRSWPQLAKHSHRVRGADEYFAIADCGYGEFDSPSDLILVAVVKLVSHVGRVVGVQDGLAVVLLNGPNNSATRSVRRDCCRCARIGKMRTGGGHRMQQRTI